MNRAGGFRAICSTLTAPNPGAVVRLRNPAARIIASISVPGPEVKPPEVR